MKAKQLIVGVLISAACVCFSLAPSYGAETTVIVNLQKKIKNNISETKIITQDAEKKINDINKEIEPLVGKIETTEDDLKREALANKYYELRAKEIYHRAYWGKEVEKKIVNICSDMGSLSDEIKRIGHRENERLGASDAIVVRQTLKGLANAVAPLYALNREDPRYQYLAMTLHSLDSQYKTFFKNDSGTSLDQQIAYMEDLHAFIRSVMTTLDMERVYLQNEIFVVMSDGVVKFINDLSNDVHGSPVLVSASAERHRLDARVKGQRPAVKAFGNRDFDPNTIGNW